LGGFQCGKSSYVERLTTKEYDHSEVVAPTIGNSNPKSQLKTTKQTFFFFFPTLFNNINRRRT